MWIKFPVEEDIWKTWSNHWKCWSIFRLKSGKIKCSQKPIHVSILKFFNMSCLNFQRIKKLTFFHISFILCISYLCKIRTIHSFMEPQRHPMSFICPTICIGTISLCIMIWTSWGSNSFVSNGNEGQMLENDKIKISDKYVAACSLDWKMETWIVPKMMSDEVRRILKLVEHLWEQKREWIQESCKKSNPVGDWKCKFSKVSTLC